MIFLRSNTILDFYESSPALHCNLFFLRKVSSKKRIYTAIGAKTSDRLYFKTSI